MPTNSLSRSPSLAKRHWRRQLETTTSLAVAVLSVLYGEPTVADEPGLQEIIVTATRHPTASQDVPISISVATGAELDKAGIQDIAGLAHAFAGISYADKGPFGGVAGSNLIIRGLNSEDTGELALASPVVPPVATYIDDTPLFLNLRLQDLDRVEILRGPQGTLYGSGSLGGTIRFVQNAPDPGAFDAKVEAGLSDTEHTHALNDDISGMLNMPVSPTFAVRLNASFTDQAGFINQPNLYVLDSSGTPVPTTSGSLESPPETYSRNGTNSYGYRTARISALWKPTDAFHAQISYYYQRDTGNGYPYSSPTAYGVGSLSSSDYSLETTEDKADLVALTQAYDMGFATLTSSTSYAHHNNQTTGDYTAIFENLAFYQSYYGANPRAFVQNHAQLDDKLWSEEIRIASTTAGTVDWVGGLFFKNQQTNIQAHVFYPGYNAFYDGCVSAYGAGSSQCGFGEYGPINNVSQLDGIPLAVDQAYIGDFETQFKDLAAYGELTWHLSSAWSVTGGARVFKQTVSQGQQTGLLFDGPGFVANESLSDSWTRALGKLNTAYQIDKSNLVYATWSQGFRRGGVNALPPSEPVNNYQTPASLFKLQPDTANNYEIGIKGLVSNRVRYSAAIYDVLWRNIQEGTDLTPLVLPASINLGNGYSRGVELEVAAQLTEHVAAQLGYTYDQTKLTSISEAALIGLSAPPPAVGSRLPGTPEHSLAVGVEYGHVEFAGGQLRYAVNGHYQSQITPALSATVPTVGGYSMMDAQASFTRANWKAALYVDNLTNVLGVNSYTDPYLYGKRYSALVSRPRTIGLTIGYSFREW
jgi:outer membrane receptor protein involved in Fe transport